MRITALRRTSGRRRVNVTSDDRLIAMAVLTYLLYGDNPTYELEFLLGALSARVHLRTDRDADPIRLVLISDRPRFGEGFPFDVHVVPRETVHAWARRPAAPKAGQPPRGAASAASVGAPARRPAAPKAGQPPRGAASAASVGAPTSAPGRVYNHRIKVLALLEAMHLAADGEPVALVDTDTIFTASPRRLFERIGPDATVMHEQEVPAIADDPDCADVVEYIRNGVEIGGFRMSPATPLFNSGVIGVLPSHRPLVEQVLALLDALYDRAPVFNVEQFAFGVVLDQRTKLATCKDVVRHYWGHTRGFIHVQAARHLGPRDAKTFREREMQPLPYLGEPTKAWQDKVASRLRGALGHWSQEYRFAYLAARSAHREASRDPAFANAWAALALEGLQRLAGEASTPRVRADFSAWFAQPAARLPWLDRELHARWQAFLVDCSVAAAPRA
jgi:hypothetical protein